MIGMEEWVDIAAAHHRGVPIKEIARKTRLSQNTIRKAIRSEGVPKHERPPVPSKLDPYKDHLRKRLERYPGLSVEKLFGEIGAMGV